MLGLSLLVLLLAWMTCSAALVPVNFAAGRDTKWSYGVSVANYDAGAAFTESYNDAEHLLIDSHISSRSYGPGTGSLEASINSEVIGSAHIAWQSVEQGRLGRPMVVGRSVEDMTGVFSVEKFIQLWSGNSSGEVSIDWLPCF